jgi:DNA-binding NarL/FixJ family response regulator
MIKIFLADDHYITKAGITKILISDPEIIIAGDASSYEELMKKIYNINCDLLILDVEFPDKCGLDAIPILKKRIPELKILILSNHNENEIVNKALKNGCNGYLTKDNAVEELLKAVQAIIKDNFYIGSQVLKKNPII